MSEREFENFYRERLEEDIILALSKQKNIPFEEAMRLYYTSNLANRIYHGEYGIQYLDYSVLVDILEREIDEQAG